MSTPFLSGQREHLLAKALMQIRNGQIDDRVGAGRPHDVLLVLAGDRGEHLAAERLGQLDRGQADAAGRAEHQHGLARRDPAAVLQREIGGVVNQRHRRGFVERQRRRQLDALALRHHREFGEAGRLRHQQRVVAGLEFRHAVADRRDHADRQLAGNERQRRLELVAAAHHHQIDEVDRDRARLEQHLAGLGRGLGHVAEACVLDASEFADHHGAHDDLISGGWGTQTRGLNHQFAWRPNSSVRLILWFS